ncbi:CAP domain-containing protein [Streptomyces sp. NPDC086023]|uniref:CAP domain-containing protein n=1 Tax=Streptomyces sp. NPDC086023 TaxID=3365746 RepID=UPI0037D80981
MPLRIKAALAGAGTLAFAAVCMAGADLVMSPVGAPDTSALGDRASVLPEPPGGSVAVSSDPAPTPPGATASARPEAKPAPSASKKPSAKSPTAPRTSKSPAPTRSAKKPAPTPSRAPAPKAQAATSGGGSPTVATGRALEVTRLVNSERAAAGCPALKTDPALSKAAQAYSNTLAATGVLSHTGPDGSQPADRVGAAGYAWSRTGENIATGQPDAAAVMDSWMNSPGHRENILNCAFTEIGVGVTTTGGGPWWTQVFGTPA